MAKVHDYVNERVAILILNPAVHEKYIIGDVCLRVKSIRNLTYNNSHKVRISSKFNMLICSTYAHSGIISAKNTPRPIYISFYRQSHNVLCAWLRCHSSTSSRQAFSPSRSTTSVLTLAPTRLPTFSSLFAVPPPLPPQGRHPPNVSLIGL